MLSSKIIFRFLVIGLLAAVVSGCAAVHTSIAKRNLDVQTRISSAIFVDPVLHCRALLAPISKSALSASGLP